VDSGRVGHILPDGLERPSHAFPSELPRRVLFSTWPGDIVLDPLCSSGTTVKVVEGSSDGSGSATSSLTCTASRPGPGAPQEVLSLDLCAHDDAGPGASRPASPTIRNAVASNGEGFILPVAAQHSAPCRGQGRSLFRFSEKDAERKRSSLDADASGAGYPVPDTVPP
jgi:hypothetical protein